MALNISDRIELTRVHHNFDGDTYFPEIDAKIWMKQIELKRKRMITISIIILLSPTKKLNNI